MNLLKISFKTKICLIGNHNNAEMLGNWFMQHKKKRQSCMSLLKTDKTKDKRELESESTWEIMTNACPVLI
jgi:hypothetical protein